MYQSKKKFDRLSIKPPFFTWFDLCDSKGVLLSARRTDTPAYLQCLIKLVYASATHSGLLILRDGAISHN